MLAVGRKKAVTLETVRSIKFIFKQFRLSPAKVRRNGTTKSGTKCIQYNVQIHRVVVHVLHVA